MSAVTPRARWLTTQRGRRYGYEQLLIATGARPRRLNVPGAELDGVFTLRSLADSASIRDAARGGNRAAVVGGGFIGMEVAASLRRLGLQVALIHLGSGLFDQLGSRDLSDQLASLYSERGVEVLLEQEVAAFGGDGRLAYVETKSGDRVEADLAVVGVGVVPNVEFLAGSGLALENGIVVNERFEASAPGVYAVGDVANFFDPLYGRRRRIEHWSNANYQGAEVGRVLAGEVGGYDTVSSFFSEVFGTTIKVFGDTSHAEQLSSEGSLEAGFLASYGDRGPLVGAIHVGQSEELEALVKDLIAERAPADALARELVGGEVMTSRLHRLSELGQSVWIDFLPRDLLESGALARAIADDAVVGVTSNPTIFAKALSGGNADDAQIATRAGGVHNGIEYGLWPPMPRA